VGNVSNVFESFLEILQIDFESRVGYAYLIEFLCLILQLLLLALEILELIRNLRPRDLLALMLL